MPNLIEATVTACRPADGEYVLSVESGSGHGDCRAGQAFGPGEQVVVMVRPEDVALAANGAAASSSQLTWTGKVVDGVFRGPRRSLSVETASLRFNVECPATRAAAVGEAVTLLVDAGNAWAMKP